MEAMPAEIPVTICKPGKRAGSKAVARAAVASTMLAVSTATAMQWPSATRLPPPVPGDRRTAQERVEAAERSEARSVALAQPHRSGSDDPRMAFPLWRYCVWTWPSDADHAGQMYSAGVKYADDVRAVCIARGFHVVDSEGDNGGGANSADELSPDEIKAARDNIYALERTLERANELLRSVMPRLPAAMVRLCCDHGIPSIYDADTIKSGLYRLGVHYGIVKRGINHAGL